MTTTSRAQKEREKRHKEVVVAAMLANRRTADRILDRTALVSVERVWDSQVGKLATGLSRYHHLALEEAASPAAVAATLDWLRVRLPAVSRAIGHVLATSTRHVVTEGVQSIGVLVGQIRGSVIPLDNLALLNRVISARTTELERLRLAAANHLAAEIHEDIAKKLLMVKPEQTVGQLVTMAHKYIDDDAYKVERLVRTECAMAYNAAANDAIVAIAGEPGFHGMFKQWREHCSDLGVPLDNRVAPDSIAMHAQITRPDGLFTQPEGSARFGGNSFPYPPNRCNDRAVVTPWEESYGIPGWQYKGWTEPV